MLCDLAERERPIICIDAVSPWLALLRVLENILSEQGNGEHQKTEYQEQIPVEAGVRVSLGESLAEDKPTKYDDHVTHVRIVARVLASASSLSSTWLATPICVYRLASRLINRMRV